MRTTVSIKDEILRDAKKAVKTSSQSELVNLALEALVREARRKSLLEWLEGGRTELSPKKLKALRRPRVPGPR